MSSRLDDVLENELITVVERNDGMGNYTIRLGELETMISIDLGRTPDGRFVKFSVSHAIHTPTQLGPYYREAVSKSHKPNESWLVRY